MAFTPSMIRGFAVRKDPFSHVDYRLARRSMVRAFQSGRLSRLDVCDAHPELTRAARHVGEPTRERCPICTECNVVLVSYVFGDGLGASGHCVTTKAELQRLSARARNVTLYVVEVCPECNWNHLATVFHVKMSAESSRAATNA